MTKAKVKRARAARGRPRVKAPDPLPRIEALSRSARTSWLGLLSVLAFVGITLTGVQHIDFYGVGRATKLPVIDVTVPTYVFFYAAPILTLVAYGHFHLFLIRLWEVLGPAPAFIGTSRLGDKVPPWLVTDAALHLRARKRGDDCMAERPLERITMHLNILIAWGFGLFILGAVWWVSMPARDAWMTGLAALAVSVALVISYVSARVMWLRMRDTTVKSTVAVVREVRLIVLLLFAVPALGLVTYGRTVDPLVPKKTIATERDWPVDPFALFRLASIAMPNAAIVVKPAGWLPYQTARNDYLAQWCRRPGVTCTEDGSFPEGFLADWHVRRSGALNDQSKPHWHAEGARKPDWRDADLRATYFSGADLSGARIQGAKLSGAELELAELSSAQLQGADLSFSLLTGTEGIRNRLQYVNLRAAINMGGALRYSDLRRIDFDLATDFRNAFLDGSAHLPDRFHKQMGYPCQWTFLFLTDEEFYAHWRGWVEAGPIDVRWASIAPEAFRDIDPIPPEPGCEWKTGPMPGANAQP